MNPSFRHRPLPLPLVFSKAFCVLAGTSGGVKGVVGTFEDEDSSFGPDIDMAPFLVGFRSSLDPLVVGVRFKAAVAAAILASKSLRTSGSFSRATLPSLIFAGFRLDGFRLS